MEAGVDQFALQAGSWCALYQNGNNYKRYGPSRVDCGAGGAGYVNTVYQINRKAVMYGSWIGGDIPVQNVDIDSVGNTVYMIEHDRYTKMVNRQGQARYYVGSIGQYNSAYWNNYSRADGNYLVRML
jgi:hypothetical protein